MMLLTLRDVAQPIIDICKHVSVTKSPEKNSSVRVADAKAVSENALTTASVAVNLSTRPCWVTALERQYHSYVQDELEAGNVEHGLRDYDG